MSSDQTKSKTMSFTIGIILSLVVLGIFTGMLSGIVGVGGGIILVPALIYLFGISQFQAQGTSLALLMFPVGILAVMQYYKQGYIDFKLVGIIAIGFVIGSYFGSKFALSLPKEAIKKIFATLLLIVAIKMLFFDNAKKEIKAKTENQSAS